MRTGGYARAVMIAACVAAMGSSGRTEEGGVRFRDMVYKSFEGNDSSALGGQIGLADKPVEFTALEYKLLLVDQPGSDGVYVDPKTRRFKVGDRIRLEVKPLTPSYIYIYHIGASGRQYFLIPQEEEQPPKVEAKKEIRLPEQGLLDFVPPPGKETLFVIATAKPVRDRQLLAKVITTSDPAQDTPEMQAQRKEINAVVQGAVISEAERRLMKNDGSIRFRGLFSGEDRKAFLDDLGDRKVSYGSIELPPENSQQGTIALGFRSVEGAAQAHTALVVTIPLESQGGSK